MNKESAPYLIHSETGNVVMNNYVDDKSPGFAAVDKLRPLTLEEMMERNLPMPEEVSLVVAGHIEEPEYMDEYSKGELNKFAVENELVRSLNVSRPFKELLHEVRVMIAMRNKEVADATNFVPELPDNFYAKSVTELKVLCEEASITGVSFNQRKSTIQQEIVAALTAKKFKEETAILDTSKTKIQIAQSKGA